MSTEKKQVVEKVIFFSSQYGSDKSKSYTAENLAGNSYNYPNYGDFTQAFVLRSYGPWWEMSPSFRDPIDKSRRKLISEDFVDLQFAESVYPTKIEILETYNPGAVVHILALESVSSSSKLNKPRWRTLWSGVPQDCPPRARKFSPPLKRLNHPTKLIRLEFNQRHLSYYTELDAVILYGTATRNDLQHKEMTSLAPCDDAQVSITTNLFAQLSFKPDEKEKKNGNLEELGSNGYFDILPDELIHYIFSFLELIDLITAAFTCRLFSRHCFDPVWYKELDLKPYWSLITDVTLDHLQNFCTSTEKLDLTWSGPYEAVTCHGIFRFLQKCGSNLVCLRLSCCQFVNGEVIKAISKFCPNLEELDLQSCSSESSLSEDLLLELANLKRMKRINFYRVPVKDHLLKQLIQSYRNLQHLNLGDCHHITECDTIMQLLSKHCRGLVSLDVWRNRSLSDVGIMSLADGCTLLEELDVGWCSTVINAAECISCLTSKCRKLKKLFLTALRSVSDDVINALANNCPDLEQVDVLGTGLIHPHSITRLLKECKKLRFLDISFCSQLSNKFVENLRSRYPNVSIKKSFVTDEPF